MTHRALCSARRQIAFIILRIVCKPDFLILNSMDAHLSTPHSVLSATDVKAPTCNGAGPINKTYIVVLCLADGSGSLVDSLLVFKDFHISLKRIESRRSRQVEGHVDFFVEFDMPMDDVKKQAVLAALQSKSVSVDLVSESSAACQQGRPHCGYDCYYYCCGCHS